MVQQANGDTYSLATSTLLKQLSLVSFGVLGVAMEVTNERKKDDCGELGGESRHDKSPS